MRRRAGRLEHLEDLRRALIAHMQAKITDEDWHGVSDAANDLREVDAELRGLGWPETARRSRQDFLDRVQQEAVTDLGGGG